MTVQSASTADFEALGQIAYETGFFGASAARFFGDPTLFADLWVRPYLYGPGCCNHLALLDDRPIGYILGTCDLKAYQRNMAVRQVPAVLAGLFTGRYPQARASLPYLLRLLRYPARHAPTQAYPAQLHLNLLPEARGHGLGRRLLETYLTCLMDRHVSGVQLSTTEENSAALALYEKVGFKVYLEYQSPLWQPYLGQALTHVVMVKAL